MSRILALTSGILMLVAAGCDGGPRRVPVKGTLTVQGSPLGHALITFVPAIENRNDGGVGVSEAGGSFTLIGPRTLKKGLVPGDYVVLISRPMLADGTPLIEATRSEPGSTPEKAYDAIPRKYMTFSSKDALRVTVPKTGGALTVDIPEPLIKNKKR